MKKIFSVIVGMIVCCISILSPVLAAGEEKVEVLKDGTVLHYLSFDRWEKVEEEYSTYEKSILDYTEAKIRGNKRAILATVCGIIGYAGLYFPTFKTSFKNSVPVIIGKVAIASLTAAGIIYSKCKKLPYAKEFRTKYKDVPQALAEFDYFDYGGKRLSSGVLHMGFTQKEQCFQNGIIVVIRPHGTKDKIIDTGVFAVDELTLDGRLDKLKSLFKAG